MNKIFNIYKNYKEQINYLVFGVLTTAINIVVYYFAYNILTISNVISNIIAWILSVLFAYITNKYWVFENYNNKISELIYEIFSFFGCRLATGLIDLLIMYITVDILSLNSLVMKIISNVIVIILNYIASKIIVFKNKKS